MLPILIHFGPITIATFPVFMIIGSFMGLFVIWKRGKELHYEEKELFDVLVEVIAWLLIGARLGYMLIHAAEIHRTGNWIAAIVRFSWFLPIGLIVAFIALTKIVKKRRWDAYQCSDIFVTGLMTAQAIFALGSLIAGFGYGIPTTSFLGVHFANLYDNRYPVQIIEIIGYTIGFIYLWWVEGVYRTFPWYRGNKSQASTGFITGMYLLWWGIIACIATLFRTPSLVVGSVRFDVVVPIVFGIVGGVMILWYRATGSWQGMWLGLLEYFGLAKKQVTRNRRSEIQKLFD